MSKWQGVYKDTLEHRATIVKDVLGDRDIDAIIVSKKDSTHGIGHLEVLVPADQVILAIRIIQKEINFE